MKTVELGEVVAERELRLDGEGAKVVCVRIGKPQRTPGEADYYCPYQIVGVGNERVKYACGIDTVQAIEEVVRILPVELNRLLRSHPGLRWEDAAPGDFGFRPTMASSTTIGP